MQSLMAYWSSPTITVINNERYWVVVYGVKCQTRDVSRKRGVYIRDPSIYGLGSSRYLTTSEWSQKFTKANGSLQPSEYRDKWINVRKT